MSVDMELKTERLRLRPWTSADVEALHLVWSDPQTIWWGAHTALEQTAALFSKIESQGWWAVEHENDIVGNVFLRTSPRDSQRLELGYHIRSKYWGRGVATEAARALLATANGKVVEAPVVPDNGRSQSVMRKLGFTISGQVMLADRVHDLWLR
jgi:RimJ/RimL family protein N-acetyltransferase